MKITPADDVAGYNPHRDADGCTFDADAASRAIDFFPSCCTHTKGFRGKFELELWQRNIIATLFGWKRADGTRRYREAFIAVPRKNGKTNLCAGLALYCLGCDGEQGPEVYCAAYSRDQATLVFDPAAAMVRANAYMGRDFVAHDSTKRIVCQRNSGFMRAIPAEAASAHGFNASAVIFDELHTQADRELYDVLKTSQGARKQPLFVSITTAGYDKRTICHEVWEYARRVRDGIVKDPYFLPVLYEIAEGEDWQDPEVWKRVNPNLGVSISIDYLNEAFERAKAITAYENTFRNLHLNEWTEQASRWFSMDAWNKCAAQPDIGYGSECWCGLDLSTVADISAFVMVFPKGDKFGVACKFWVPGEAVMEREKRDRVPYSQWIRDGWITATNSSCVDFDQIRLDINELNKQYHIHTIAIDRWNANQIAKQLQDDGFNVGAFGQGMASMSSPCKDLERLILDGKLEHGGNPVLDWMAANVSVMRDAAGNIKPDKDKSIERIDGIVALVMGLGVWAIDQQSNVWSESEIGL